MSLFHKFLALSAAERRAVVAAVVLIGAVRIGLALLPFRHLRRLLVRLSHARTSRPLPVDRVAWAVAVAASRVPGRSTCLVQALVAQTLLARHGYRTDLRFGVARRGGGIEAHAWLEQNDSPVFGQPGPLRHTVLPPLEPRSP